MRYKSTNAGFTIIEVITSSFVLAVVSTTAIVSFHLTFTKSAVTDAQTVIVSAMENARSKAMSGYGIASTNYGVRIDMDRVVEFQGSTFSGVGTAVSFPPTVSSDQSGTDIVFERLTGAASQTITVRLFGANNIVHSIEVNQDGTITKL